MSPPEIHNPLARRTAGQVHAVDPGLEHIGIGPTVRIGREAQPLLSQIAGTSNGPPLVSPMKATPMFSGMRVALVRSIPDAPRLTVRSEWISSAGSPSMRVFGLYASPAPEKQTSDTRTAAPSITHGSSDQASKIGRPWVAACNARRFAPPRIEFVATKPARVALPDAICSPAFTNQ